jgi:hypothetical protein
LIKTLCVTAAKIVYKKTHLTMRLSFENVVDAKLAVIPLYPLAQWNDTGAKRKAKGEGDGDATPTFNEIKLELRSNPENAASVKVGAFFKVFENGTPEQWCCWRDDLNRAWKGLNNTTGPNRATTVRHLLEGQALDDFEQYFLPDDVTETVANVDKALKKVAANIFPADAVMNMKQYLNFELKKPNKLTARETMTRLQRINKWLGEYFPSDGGERTGEVEEIDAQELKLIYYRLLPNNWRRKMDENGSFSHHEATLQQIVEYAERLEVTEQRYGGNPKGSAVKKNGQKGNSQGGSSKGGSEVELANGGRNRHQKQNKTGDCHVHGPNCGHTSHQCKVLKGHAEKVRAQWAAQPKSGSPAKKKQQVKFKNSTVVDRKYSRAEVNAMINKLKKKFDEETREREELNEMMQDMPEVDEPLTDAELEEILNHSE